jgi:hypothetical protein
VLVRWTEEAALPPPPFPVPLHLFGLFKEQSPRTEAHFKKVHLYFTGTDSSVFFKAWVPHAFDADPDPGSSVYTITKRKKGDVNINYFSSENLSNCSKC